MLDFFIAILQRGLDLILNFLPYVIFGVLLAEILRYTSWLEFIQKAFSKFPKVSVLIAALLGIVSPLCTYGTVPIILRLYKKGTPIAPLVTFLAASSLINPQLLIVTVGGFGLTFAMLRLISVFIFSILLGTILVILRNHIKEFDRENVNSSIKESSKKRVRDINNFKLWEFLLGAGRSFKFIGKYLLIGVGISVLLEAIVPISLLFDATTMEWINIIFAAFVSIPVYICGGGVIPLVQVLMENGMSTGAAMAFLVVGPATRVTALTALGSFLSKRMVVFYVIFLIVYTLILGLILNWLRIPL